jgi:hypothetical protein
MGLSSLLCSLLAFSMLLCSHGLKIAPANVLKKVRLASAALVLAQTFAGIAHADPSMKEQLRALQNSQIDTQLVRLNKLRALDSNLNPGFVSRSQIAKGVVQLPLPDSRVDPTLYPLGIPDAASLDEALTTDQATLFITAVGKNSGPVAAKKYKLRDLKFPLYIELTEKDLVFPYTADAWEKSSLSQGGISLTCVLDPDGKLATSEGADRFGFAVSDVVEQEGVLRRSESSVNINFKSDGAPYNAEDVDFLGRIDTELDRLGFSTF